LVAADEVEKLVIDLETGVRGFVITNEERFLERGLSDHRPHPWRFALLVASAAAVPAFVTNGPILAAVEILAVLGGFALLGRPLALRR
jgi:CHASE3 domain-containing protein